MGHQFRQQIPQFFKGQFHGIGTYSWSNGASYEGDHVKDQRTGFGVMTYPDGAAFSGIWEAGVHKEFRDTRWGQLSMPIERST